MTTTLVDLAENVDIPKKGTVVAAPTELTDLTALLGGPARSLTVGTVSGTLILTQEDTTTVTISENVLKARNGVIDHVCTHIQSAACQDIFAQR